MQLMSWPGGDRYLCPLQSLVVSLLLSLVSTLLFSRTRGVLSHRNSFTHRFLRFFRGTCVPSSRSLCSLSSTLQRTQPSVKLLSFQDWQNREFFLQRLRTLVSGHLSSHSALSGYGLFAPLALWRLSVFFQPLVQALESCPAFGAPWSSEGVGNNNNNRKTWSFVAQALCLCLCLCYFSLARTANIITAINIFRLSQQNKILMHLQNDDAHKI